MQQRWMRPDPSDGWGRTCVESGDGVAERLSFRVRQRGPSAGTPSRNDGTPRRISDSGRGRASRTPRRTARRPPRILRIFHEPSARLAPSRELPQRTRPRSRDRVECTRPSSSRSIRPGTRQSTSRTPRDTQRMLQCRCDMPWCCSAGTSRVRLPASRSPGHGWSTRPACHVPQSARCRSSWSCLCVEAAAIRRHDRPNAAPRHGLCTACMSSAMPSDSWHDRR